MSSGGGNRRPSCDYDLQGGRNAFRMSSDAWKAADENAQASDLLRQQHAMRSFTESIEMDLPPAPELPPSLDIDRYPCGLKESSTNDTIVEVIKPKKPDYDKTLGETQKYPLTVPGPGCAEQEQELHMSLIKKSDSVDSEIEMIANSAAGPSSSPSGQRNRPEMNADHAALRREYSNTVKQRPRPTTPTSGCALESYVEHTHSNKLPPDSGAKMRVTLPGQSSHSSLRRKSSMSWNDFHDSMTRPRSSSILSGRSTPLNDYEGDILDEDPVLSKKAPPAPVVHRRTSVDWENFEDDKDRQVPTMEAPSPAVPTTSEEAADPTVSNTAKRASIPASTPPPSPQNREDQEKMETETVEVVRKASEQLSHQAIEEIRQVQEGASEEAPADPHTTEVQPQEEPHQIEVPQHDQMDYSHLSGYDSSQYYGQEYSGYAQTTEGDQSAYYGQYGTDQNGSAYGYSGYDTSAYGYDQAYQQQYPGYGYGTYDYSQQGQQPAEGGEYSQDQSGYGAYGHQEGTADYSQYAQGTEYSGYDQQGAEGTDYSQYNQHPESSEYSGYAQQQQPEGVQQGEDVQKEGDYSQYAQGTEAYSGYEQHTTEGVQGEHSQEAADYSQYAAQTGDEGAEYGQCGAQNQAEGATDYSAYTHQTAEGDDYSSYGQQHATEVSGDYSGYASTYGQQADYSNYGQQPQEDYSSYGTDQQSNNYAYSSYGQPSTIKPLISVPEKRHDPYAWDAQEAHTGSEQPSEEAKPSRPPPPAEQPHRPPPPRPTPPGAKAPDRPPPPSASQQAPPRPPPAHLPPPKKEEKKKQPEPEPEEEDPWARFKKMTENVSTVVKSTEETLKNMSEHTVANEIKDESYISQVGGGQVYDPVRAKLIKESQEKEKRLKKEKKEAKKGKKPKSPDFDPAKEENLDRVAAELAKKMAEMRTDLSDWKPPSERQAETAPKEESSPEMEEVKEESIKRKESMIENQQSTSLDIPMTKEEKSEDSAYQPIGDVADESVTPSNWAGFDDRTAPELPPSESGFFAKNVEKPPEDVSDAFGGPSPVKSDPFAPVADTLLLDQAYDPFEVRPVEEIVAEVKARAAAEAAALEAAEDLEFFAGTSHHNGHSNLSTPTPEGGSPVSSRPIGFDDDFKEGADDLHTPTPLFDEDDKEPLEEFPPKFAGDGWDLMIRHPVKKKIMSDRFWKPCYARIQGTTLLLFNSKQEQKPFHELMLQACYSLSDVSLQAYDVYGKIHTVKLQHVLYKERVGIRPGQISRLMEGHITKYGMPLEHSAQCTVLLKFGCLNAAELASFVTTVEDILFRCPARRETTPTYKQDEVQVHCYDEYCAYVDKNNVIKDQKARVRLFCLAFVTGSPFLEVGLNDLRRQGKEIVRRKDILPMYTERWIRFENLEFHNTVEKDYFDKEQVVRLQPPDGCFFEVMRFRVRPPKNREKPLNIKCLMKIAGSKIEIRLEAMAAAQTQRGRGASESIRQIPCEDIQIRFPIPEAWIYLFREERHWGVGSVHAKVRRPGKVKNLKDRLMGAMQTTDNSLIEVAIGEAKYEHVYRALVWRIPRLPEKHHAAYKRHLLLCRFELSSFDLMPETFLPTCDVEFTMPLATISNTVVRSVGVEQHEDSDRVEKFVRYVAKCQYKFEIDYVQCTELDADPISSMTNASDAMMGDTTVPDAHQTAFHPDQVGENHEGYRIDFSKEEVGEARQADSSSDEDEEPTKNKMPIIQIDMKGYGY
ncbi:hypothetical protein QR680_004712 [Steinernema hermaphroditum]|uniref:MHD domain-containing protein n=1 Tax=Steinernema hermaphroditum TaxID=289476 RepID=A0AA39HPK6_9BILA|nr:hypothetical protein QR680_004712 [Steinernema hermaphroditum]